MKTKYLHTTDLSRFNRLNWIFNSQRMRSPYNLSNMEDIAIDGHPQNLILHDAIWDAEFFEDVMRFRRIDYAFYRAQRF